MIRIGIFGAGFMGWTHLEAYRKVGGAEVIGVSGARPENLKKFGGKFKIKTFPAPESLLEKVDAVDICLPTFLHAEYTCLAAAAGRHVLCEKPIALAEMDAQRMIRTCRKAGVIFMVAHCIRFWPEYVYLKRALDSGELGKLLILKCWRAVSRPSWFSRNWALSEEKSGGALLDLHIHDADFILYLLGEPRRVLAKRMSTSDSEFVTAEYDYPDGKIVQAEAGWLLRSGYPFHMAYRAVFEKGIIEYDSRNFPTITLYREGKKTHHPPIPQTDGYMEEIRYFLRCVAKNARPEVASGDSALQTIRLIHKYRIS